MKKITTAAFCIGVSLLMSCLYSKAQTFEDFRKLPAQQKAQLVTDSFKVALSLTSVQCDKVYAIMLDGVQKAAPIMQGNDSRMSKGKQLKKLLTAQENKMKPVLSAEQFALYQSKKQKAIAYYRKHWQEQKLVFNTPG